ncbi:MAG: hypothetical protein LUH10_03920 [Tannerellaceae bacterium]|nr:hypothetical protein [Tannerellaceae bacterium]
MPNELTINGITNKYTYAADGSKLKVEQGSTVREYTGSKVYENGSLKRILLDGGYIEGGTYHFYLTDHLGNVRVVADQNGTVKQTNEYYPFGNLFAESTGSEQQLYKYNGKELDTAQDLNLYDYHARHYDPKIARFTTIDPLAEKYYNISPYAYCFNNPVNVIDPLGLDTVNVQNVNWSMFNPSSDIIAMNDIEITPVSAWKTIERSGIYYQYNTITEAYGGVVGEKALKNVSIEFDFLLFGKLFYRGTTSVVSSLLKKKSISTGQSFGKLGKVIMNPGLKLTCISTHAAERALARGVSMELINKTVANPSVVLQQTNGTYLYLTKEAAVVLNNSGKLVTTYSSQYFDSTIINIINLLP